MSNNRGIVKKNKNKKQLQQIYPMNFYIATKISLTQSLYMKKTHLLCMLREMAKDKNIMCKK